MQDKLINKRPEFLMAISQPSQLMEWLEKHPYVMGLVMAGRSNVGKSTLINSLFGKGTARTSKTPGRTREVLIFLCEYVDKKSGQILPFYLFDLPGYGYANVSKTMSANWEELLLLFFERLSPQVCILNIQDGRHPDSDADEQFSDFIRPYAIEVQLIFNKIDKLKTQKERSVLNKAKEGLIKKYKWVKQVHFISAEQGEGMPELVSALKYFLVLKGTGSVVEIRDN